MAELFVMCPECGLRGTLTHSKQEFDDPESKCTHQAEPAECPRFRPALVAARRMLDLLEWRPKREEASSADFTRATPEPKNQ